MFPKSDTLLLDWQFSYAKVTSCIHFHRRVQPVIVHGISLQILWSPASEPADHLSRRQAAQMAKLMDLPFELLNAILLWIATTPNGAHELARASATCKKFRTIANQAHILRAVNLQNVSLCGQCGPHHRINGLLSKCVLAGNPTAERMLGQAIIQGGAQLWAQMLDSDFRVLCIKVATFRPLWEQCYIAESLQTGSIADVPYILFCSEHLQNIHEAYERLRPWRLVRSFLSQADPRTIFDLCEEVEGFCGFFVGQEMAHESGINLAIVEMSFYEMNATPDALRRIEAGEHLGDERLAYLSTLVQDDGGPSYREEVLSIFDDMYTVLRTRGSCGI